MKKKESVKYIIITPARNERSFIEETIKSVVSQTIPPQKWIIVSDGSNDGTDEIVGRYLNQYPWIEMIRLDENRDRTFAAKVLCFNAGYIRAQGEDYDVIGNLDADICFEPDYFEYLINKFSENSELGVAGTPFTEASGYSSATDSYEGEKHVAGGCQLFRRKCFEQIGGYVPVAGGGIDWIAVTTARMMGWKTVSFKERSFYHNRKLGTAQKNKYGALFDYGKKDYFLGGHPIWELVRLLYQASKKPYIIGGVILMAGYLYGLLFRIRRPVSKELMKFHRKEQMEKLKKLIQATIRFQKVARYQSTL